jgi:2-isopropylmalate synthase
MAPYAPSRNNMQIHLFDTTLRDGTQSEGLSLSVEDKLKIARVLDGFGIHYIEGGYPGSNPKDIEFFRRARDLRLGHAKLTAFGSTRKAGGSAASDANMLALVEAATPVVCIFGKSWLLHVTTVLNTTAEENLAMVGDSVAFLKQSGREVVYDGEHFFDGYRANPEYALATLKAAAAAGADWITLCDTNGGCLPAFVAEVVQTVRGTVPTRIGIHTHNDSDLAVANSLAAVEAGATMVQGTMNGWGERCGNANLISIIPALQLKMDRRCVPEENLARLTELSRTVSEIANIRPRAHAPYVGSSAFAHKGGAHVAAVEKLASTYEHVPPERIGISARSWSPSSRAGATSGCGRSSWAPTPAVWRRRSWPASRTWRAAATSSRQPRARSSCWSAAPRPATPRPSRCWTWW